MTSVKDNMGLPCLTNHLSGKVYEPESDLLHERRFARKHPAGDEADEVVSERRNDPVDAISVEFLTRKVLQIEAIF